MDRISINNLHLNCKIGITPEEREKSQEVLLDLGLITNLARAGASDDLRDTVNYHEAIQRISKLTSSKQFNLLENLAENIASLVFEMAGVERVNVKVRKAKYSTEPSITIEIERSRDSDRLLQQSS